MPMKSGRNLTQAIQERADILFRRVSWRRRRLPDFIIIGAQKSGTTSLFDYLSQHPQLLPARKKEVHFFDGGIGSNVDTFAKGEPWYRAHFPLESEIGLHRRTFEASPLYIFNPLVPQRLAALAPTVKLIAILRNPTERAISHYFHVNRRGREPLPMMEAFTSEEERLRPVLESQDYKSETFRLRTYKSRGRYHEQLKRFLPYFQMTNILTINSAELFQTPQETLQRVYRFVGVDDDFTVSNLNPSNVGRNKTDVDPAVYAYLDNYFRPHNQALYELLGQDFGW